MPSLRQSCPDLKRKLDGELRPAFPQGKLTESAASEGAPLTMKRPPHNKPSLAAYQKSSRRKRISITLDASRVSALDERGKHRGEQIVQDLRRYYRLLAEGRLALHVKVSTEKLSLILEACNGWTMDPEAPRHLWIQVAEG